MPHPIADGLYFNPRSREGSDDHGKDQRGNMDISIHAPAKGATMRTARRLQVRILFQSTLPRRERLEGVLNNIAIFIISIHAPAKGATAFVPCFMYFSIFQSTLPRRERLAGMCICHLRSISIHAPAKGATQTPGEAYFLIRISIHAPAKGATANLYNSNKYISI